jgi:hypothetical protein
MVQPARAEVRVTASGLAEPATRDYDIAGGRKNKDAHSLNAVPLGFAGGARRPKTGFQPVLHFSR